LPLLTSITTVMLTLTFPVFVTLTVNVTSWPALIDVVERPGVPSWILGNGGVTMSVMVS